jgi:hypothetical protein
MRWILVVVAAIGCHGGAAAPDSAPGAYDPCQGKGTYDWQGMYLSHEVTIPRVALDGTVAAMVPGYVASAVPVTFSGAVLSPADTATYAGPRPAAILQHGHTDDQCALWWLAGALAGHGYIAIVYTQPDNAEASTFGSDVTAVYSAMAFLASNDNPMRASTNVDALAILGHSEGSATATMVQGLPGTDAVKAIVALDNLRHWLLGDPGAAVGRCVPPQEYPMTPRVPALGFAKDGPCDSLPGVLDPDIKESGFNWWRAAGIPAVEFVAKGTSHTSFTTFGGTDEALRVLAAVTIAWLDAWVSGDTVGLTAMRECTFEGHAMADLLSTTFHSGVYLPASGVDVADYRAALVQRCP